MWEGPSFPMYQLRKQQRALHGHIVHVNEYLFSFSGFLPYELQSHLPLTEAAACGPGVTRHYKQVLVTQGLPHMTESIDMEALRVNYMTEKP